MTSDVRGSRRIRRLRAAAFVFRLVAGAGIALRAAEAMGLAHPVWAVVSSMVVAQESVADTHRSIRWRALGSMLGALVAAIVATALQFRVGHPYPALLAAVAICAVIARRWPLLRVSMWTAAIVILTATVQNSIFHTALQRSGEVLLGGAIGGMLHLALEPLLPRAPAASPG